MLPFAYHTAKRNGHVLARWITLFFERSYGHVDAAFKDNMTKEEAQQFVRKAISHAMARDGSSGGVVRMVVIDKTGVSIHHGMQSCPMMSRANRVT